jgi:Na+-translocating ferredoxin:NAD+ oxidoreductase RnfC subunit
MVRIGTSLEDIIKDRVKSGIDLRFVENSSLTGASLCDMSLPINRTFKSIISLIEGNEKEFLSFMLPGAKKDSYCHVFLSTLFEKMTKIKKGCDTNLHGEVRPCLSCGFCSDICPVNLLPHLLFHQVSNDIIDETLIKYNIFDCVECNLCSYVCPSKIPLGQSIKDGKGKLSDEGFTCPKPDFSLEREAAK